MGECTRTCTSLIKFYLVRSMRNFNIDKNTFLLIKYILQVYNLLNERTSVNHYIWGCSIICYIMHGASRRLTKTVNDNVLKLLTHLYKIYAQYGDYS